MTTIRPTIVGVCAGTALATGVAVTEGDADAVKHVAIHVG
jgi:hypothetical protein